MRQGRLETWSARRSVIWLLMVFLVLAGAQPGIAWAQDPNPPPIPPVPVVQWSMSTGWVSPPTTLSEAAPQVSSPTDPVQPIVQWARPGYAFVQSQPPQFHSYYTNPSLLSASIF